MNEYSFEVQNDDVLKRIDLFLTDNMGVLSRNNIQKLIKDKKVFVNNKNVKHSYKLQKNDFIQVFIDEPKELEVTAQNIPLDIIFEDEHIVVVNKPKGMVVHPAVGNYEGTLVNALLHHCKGQLSGINGVMRPGIVHRIDKDTTGLLVVSKSNEAHIGLAKQFEEHTINRIYNAIVFNNVKEDEGTIDKPIGRHPTERTKMAITSKNSKRAVTHYKVLERFGKYTFVEFKLETGRTHQIRVHMAYNGNPLLGDYVYCKNTKITYGFDGQALHAKVLGFNHPITNKYMEFEAKLPANFEIAIHKMREK